MNWSEEWRKLVLRSSLKKRSNPFTSEEFVEWYNLQLKHNKYPGILLEKIKDNLHKHSTVLDIGAGTGAFAIPLAKEVKEVTVVEPSKEMLAYLRRNSDITNIHIINKRWEDVSIEEVGQHDLVLAAYSLYNIIDINTALKKMISAAKKHLYIIIEADHSNFYTRIWQCFKGEEYHPPPSFIHLYNVLYELGILANVEIIRTSWEQVYLSIKQAVKLWMARLDLPPEKEDKLRAYLLDHLKEKDGILYLEEKKQSAIIYVDISSIKC